MPDITEAGTYTRKSPGFKFLRRTNSKRVLLFGGNSLGSSVSIQYTDDRGTDRTIENGEVSLLPKSVCLDSLNADLKIVVTGTPDFNVTGA